MIQIPLQQPTDLADGDVALDGPQEAASEDGVFASALLAGGQSSNTLSYASLETLSGRESRFRVVARVSSTGPVNITLAVLIDGAVEMEETIAYEGGSGIIEREWNYNGTEGSSVGATIAISNQNGDLTVGVDYLSLFSAEVGAATGRPSSPRMQQAIRKARR